VVAATLYKMHLYHGRAARAEGRTGNSVVVPPQGVEMYNKLASAAYWLDVSAKESQWLYHVANQSSYGASSKILDAIKVIAEFGRQVDQYEPLFVDLCWSMGRWMEFFSFICGGRPDKIWGADRSAMQRFFADFQQLCGTNVPEDRVLDCWNAVTDKSAGGFTRASIEPLRLTRNERAELDAWRARLAADA
jgi:hypothetical protein